MPFHLLNSRITSFALTNRISCQGHLNIVIESHFSTFCSLVIHLIKVFTLVTLIISLLTFYSSFPLLPDLIYPFLTVGLSLYWNYFLLNSLSLYGKFIFQFALYLTLRVAVSQQYFSSPFKSIFRAISYFQLS